MESTEGDVTRLLRRMAEGDAEAGNELAPHIFGELHRMAAYYLRREREPHTWQTTDLLNEAYLKLAKPRDNSFNGRSHFFGVAAKIMRSILTDYARRKQAEMHGGKAFRIPLEDDLAIAPEECKRLTALEEALGRLEAIDKRMALVVELRFFGGLTEDEVAEVLGVSTRTVKRLWETARAWLFGQLNTGRKK